MSLVTLGLCATVLAGSQHVAAPKQISAPASDLLNNRLRSPDPSTIGRPFGHAMLAFSFDENGQWQYELPVPPTMHLSILPVGPGCEEWDLVAINPSGEDAGDNRLITEGDLQPFFPVALERIDIANPMPGSWSIIITGGQPGDSGQLIVRDRSGIALQLHPASHVALVGHPIILRSALAPVDRSGSPLQDAFKAMARGLDVSTARIRWQDDRGDFTTSDLLQNGPWLEHSFTPHRAGPHLAHLEVEGIDSDGFRFIRTAHWHCHVEAEVSVIAIQMTELDTERLAIDLELSGNDSWQQSPAEELKPGVMARVA